jgi:hypothetical protein
LSDIDDFLQGASNHYQFAARAKECSRGILFSLPQGEPPDGQWFLSWAGNVTRGDLAHAISVLQAEFTKLYIEDTDET